MDVASNSTLTASKVAEVTKIFILSLICVHKKVCTLPLLINKMFNPGKLELSKPFLSYFSKIHNKKILKN